MKRNCIVEKSLAVRIVCLSQITRTTFVHRFVLVFVMPNVLMDVKCVTKQYSSDLWPLN